jgi:hypothetical protein
MILHCFNTSDCSSVLHPGASWVACNPKVFHPKAGPLNPFGVVVVFKTFKPLAVAAKRARVLKERFIIGIVKTGEYKVAFD